MKLLFLLLLLSPSLALDLDPEPRKQNIVTKFLEDILNKLFHQLSAGGVSAPLLDLGAPGNFSDVKATASGPTRDLDGVGNHGFRLHANVSQAAVCGNYHLVHLDVPGLFPFFGKGHFCVEMEAVRVNISLKAIRNFGTGRFEFSLTEFSVQVSSSKVKFDNLMDDPHVADFLNELLSNLLPDLVPVIAKWSAEGPLPALIDKYGNGIYDCLKEVDIMKCINDLFKTKLLS